MHGVSEFAGRHARAALPTGDVTFLFGDIEGATARSERYGEAMNAATRRYDAIVRGRIEANGGFLFKTFGDAFCAAFAWPAEALAAALAAQRVLAEEDFAAVDGIAVRMALHRGVAEERDDDYFGPPLNRVARLLAVAHGGQVVLSESAARGLHDASLSCELRDLGLHRLKDLIEPERVFGVVVPDLRADFPPLRSLGLFDNNLPQQLTPLIQRETEVAAVQELLACARLVALVGAGGVGKTRVALQAGANLLESFADGVWLVDLSPLGSAAYIVAEIASVFGIREGPDRTLEDAVLSYLRHKELLLILDNCEHLMTEATRIASLLVRATPQVSILSATREALGIAGERVYRLPSLAVPPAGAALTADVALTYGAVALFVERASSANRTFRFGDVTASTVGDVVRRLDGIPLAIELAAARMSALAPAQLAAKLDERFRMLTFGNRGALPRQQTMRAAIGWSYDLLADDERKVFRQLTIFSGGWGLDAARAICRESGDGVVPRLRALVSKSLVVLDASDTPRYRLLESIRQYGLERLAACDEETLAAGRHATYFAEFARRSDAAWDTTPDLDWYAHVDSEFENLRAALDWTIERRHDPLLGASLAAALRPFWSVKAPVEGRRWLERARPFVDVAREPALAAAIAVGLAGTAAGRTPRTLPGLAEAIAIYRALGDERGLARALVFYGDTLAWLGRVDEGERALDEALTIHRRRADEQLVAVDLCALAVLQRIRGNLVRSRDLFASALTSFEAVQSTRGRAAVLANLADLEFAASNAAQSVGLAAEAQHAYRLLGDRARVAQLDCSVSGYCLVLERYDAALAHARLALRPLRDAGDVSLLTLALQHAAVAAGFTGDHARAARLLAYPQSRFPSLPRGAGAIEPQVHDRITTLLRDGCLESELARLRAEGEALTQDRAIEEALR